MSIETDLVARPLAISTFAGSDVASAIALEADQFLRWGIGPTLDVGAIVAIYAPKSSSQLPPHERGVIRHLFTVVRPTYDAPKGLAWRNIVFLGQRVALRQAVTLEELKSEKVTNIWALPKTNFKYVGFLKRPLTTSEAVLFWSLVARRNDLREVARLLTPQTVIQPSVPGKQYKFDIAISFAGEDRVVARRLATALKAAGVNVFFDEFAAQKLFGADLVEKLDDIYQHKARFCMPILSANYVRKVWTRHELRSALARAVVAADEYLLPVRLDDTEVPGIRGTIGYLDLRHNTIERVVAVTTAKLADAAAA